jgi:cell division protein FtsL
MSFGEGFIPTTAEIEALRATVVSQGDEINELNAQVRALSRNKKAAAESVTAIIHNLNDLLPTLR